MSALLTAAAVLGLASQCQHSFPPDMILAIAEGESQVASGMFNPAAVRVNHNGSRDFGLMQINSGNLGWLGLTETAVMNPCISIAAAEAILRTLSAYNSGSGTRSPAYAKAAYLRMHEAASALEINPLSKEVPTQPQTDPSAIYAHPAHVGRDLVFSH